MSDVNLKLGADAKTLIDNLGKVRDGFTEASKGADQLKEKSKEAFKESSDNATGLNNSFKDQVTTMVKLEDQMARLVGLQNQFGNSQQIVNKLGVELKKAYTELSTLGTATSKYLSSVGSLAEKVKLVKDAMDFLTASGKKNSETYKALAVEHKSLAKQLKETGDTSNDLDDSLNNNSDSVEKLYTKLRNMRNVLANMVVAGQDNTEEFRQMSMEAGALADTIGDVNKRVRAISKDHQGLNALTGALRGLAGGYAVVEGATALFGDENEDLQKSLLKVNAAMAIMQGLQEVATTLNKDNSTSVYLTNKLMALKAFIIGSNTKATVTNTVATQTATAFTYKALIAQAAFNAGVAIGTGILRLFKLVLIGTGIGAFVVLLGVMITKWDAITEKFADLKRVGMGLFSGLSKAAGVFFNAIYDSIADLSSEPFKDLGKRMSAAYIEGQEEGLDKFDLDITRKQLEILIAAEKRKLSIQEAAGKETYALKKKILSEELALYDLGTDEFLDKQNELHVLEAARTLEQVQTLMNIRKIDLANRIATMTDGYEKELYVLKLALKSELEASKDSGANAKLIKVKYYKAIKELQKNHILETVSLEIALEERLLAIQDKYSDGLIDEKNYKAKSELQQRRFEKEVDASVFQLKFINARLKSENDLLTDNELEIAIKNGDKKVELTETQEEFIAQVRMAYAKKSADELTQLTIDEFQKDLETQEKIALAKVELIEKGSLNETQLTALKEQKKLEIIIEYAQKQLEIYKAQNGNGEFELQVAELEAVIAKSRKELEASSKKEPIDIFSLLGLNVEDGEKAKLIEAFRNTMNQVGAIAEQSINTSISQNQTYIDSLDEKIAKQEDVVAREEELRKKGLGSMVESEKAALAKLHEDRVKAFEKDKKLKLQKLNLQAAEQISGMITASVDIVKNLWPIPIVGPILAVASIAAMFGMFAKTQKDARSSIKAEKFSEGGKIGGKSHGQGGNKYISMDGNDSITEIEKDEFIVNKRSAKKHEHLLDLINSDKISMELVNDLLSGTKVSLDKDLPKKIMLERGSARTFRNEQENTIPKKQLTELVAIRERLEKIENNTGQSNTVIDKSLITKQGNNIKVVKYV